jgi:hypothetical protein
MIASNKLRAWVLGVLGIVCVILLSGCATMTTDQGGNAVEVAKAKYQQDPTFVAFELNGVTKMEGSNICIVARSYRPPISVVPEVSIMDKICDAAKWIGGFYIGGEVLKSVSAKTIVDPTIVRPEVITVPAQ